MASKKRNPGKLVIQETFMTVEEKDLGPDHGWDDVRYLLGEPTEYYEPFTDDLGRLFKSLRREYGRCISKVYRDTPDGTADPIGWVFQKQVEYEDADRPVKLAGQDDTGYFNVIMPMGL